MNCVHRPNSGVVGGVLSSGALAGGLPRFMPAGRSTALHTCYVAIVFGLSMDYRGLLISEITRTGARRKDASEAVRRGWLSTRGRR